MGWVDATSVWCFWTTVNDLQVDRCPESSVSNQIMKTELISAYLDYLTCPMFYTIQRPLRENSVVAWRYKLQTKMVSHTNRFAPKQSISLMFAYTLILISIFAYDYLYYPNFT